MKETIVHSAGTGPQRAGSAAAAAPQSRTRSRTLARSAATGRRPALGSVGDVGRPTAAPQFGEGPLARVTAPIYSFLVLDLLLLLTTLPTLVGLVVLARDASNAPLAVVCALPVGPAVSAALYALRHRARDLTDLHPAAAFWRGYKMNIGGVLRVWVPYLAGMALIAENLSHAKTAAIPPWWRAALFLVAVVATLWMLNALLISSLFAFRPVDVARLAAYFLGRTRGVTLGNLGVLIAAAAVVDLCSEAVLALFAVLFAAAVLRVCAPLADQVERDFTA